MGTIQESIQEFIPQERYCSYLPQESSLFRYFYIKECSNELYLVLLERGWRRFGEYFFVPICHSCIKCVSIRTDILGFEPSNSHKRVLRKNRDTKIIINRPTMSDEKLALYDKYHNFMNGHKGWEYRGITKESYSEMFVEGGRDFGFEFDFFIEGKLVAVGFVDILPPAISAVYFFYDPDFRSYSLGVFSLLKQFDIGKKMGIKHLYPGYWIENHHSMGYKDKFTPFEVLTNRPDLNDIALWEPYSHANMFWRHH